MLYIFTYLLIWLMFGLAFCVMAEVLHPDEWDDMPTGAKVLACLGGPIFPIIGAIIVGYKGLIKKLRRRL